MAESTSPPGARLGSRGEAPREWVGHPFWGLGFRPFFLLSAIAAVVLMGLWAAYFHGQGAPPAIDPVTWHGHEMVFGFGAAMAAGFLLTASQNWTGRRGVNGRPLQALAALWLAGRVAMWFYPQPRIVPAVVDSAFLPLLAFLLWPYLGMPSQRRNLVFYAYLAVLLAGNLMVHAGLLGWWAGAARSGLWLGVYGLVLLLVLVGGRVIPGFSRNVVPGGAVHVRPWVERLSHGFAAALLCTVFLPAESWVTHAIALAGALVHAARWAGWFDWRLLRRPILWILYAGYGWAIAGFALLGAGPWIGLPPGDGLHAFAVGGIGVLIYGMTTRIALGHTGRPIAADPVIVLGYVLINLAALARVAAPLLGGAFYGRAILWAALCWVLAFVLFLIRYAPILLRPRTVD